MAQANDLIVLFLGLEVLSIALYVLAGYHARRRASLQPVAPGQQRAQGHLLRPGLAQ